jgi:hypothetical protein
METDEELELPASVCSDAPSQFSLELPESVLDSENEFDSADASGGNAKLAEKCVAPGLDSRCSCKLNCLNKFSAELVEETRMKYMKETSEDKRQKLFLKIKAQLTDRDGNVALGKVKLFFSGQRVCKLFWLHCHGVSHTFFDRAVQLIRAGHTTVIAKQKNRLPSSSSTNPQQILLSSWFQNLYTDLAEPLAEADPDAKPDAVTIEPDHPLWQISIALGVEGDKRCIPVRYLNPGTIGDLFAQYEVELGANAASRSTFQRVWNRWKKYIRFRNIGQGKRCRVCAHLDQMRTEALSSEDKAEVTKQKMEHIRMVMADREVSVRANRTAERDASKPSSDGAEQIIKITIDGMDQAKFRVPRNLASSAEFESLWRPTLHVVGCVVHGRLEAYFIMPSDVPKDANMNCTIISRVLDLVQEQMQSQGSGNIVMPQNLILAADNTARESKNQIFANFAAYLVGVQRFETVEVQFLQVGHTHNELDQRFSTVATTLSRAPTLEDPDEFASLIRQQIFPPRGRTLVVEVLNCTYDFQGWFQAGLGSNISGLAATHVQPETNHVWRFVPRYLLPHVAKEVVVSTSLHEEWSSKPEADSDVLLFVKEFMHSPSLSQQPLLFQPHVVAAALPVTGLSVMPRNPLSEKTIQQFLKTAAAVAQPPWHLFKAQAYLESLCCMNQTALLGPPPFPLRFVFQHEMVDANGLSHNPFELMQLLDRNPPREVVVHANTKKKGNPKKACMKRPAAAATTLEMDLPTEVAVSADAADVAECEAGGEEENSEADEEVDELERPFKKPATVHDNVIVAEAELPLEYDVPTDAPEVGILRHRNIT